MIFLVIVLAVVGVVAFGFSLISMDGPSSNRYGSSSNTKLIGASFVIGLVGIAALAALLLVGFCLNFLLSYLPLPDFIRIPLSVILAAFAMLLLAGWWDQYPTKPKSKSGGKSPEAHDDLHWADLRNVD